MALFFNFFAKFLLKKQAIKGMLEKETKSLMHIWELSMNKMFYFNF